MKSIITYYGGKGYFSERIVSMMPPHTTYCEPFCGAAWVFYRREKAGTEVLNDTNENLVNMYRTFQDKVMFDELRNLVIGTLHSRYSHDQAKIIYKNPELFDQVRRAWATWVIFTQSFAGKSDGAWGMNIDSAKKPIYITNNKNRFDQTIFNKFAGVKLYNEDALYVIKKYDSEKSFFYIDPPYYNADMGHYKGYTLDDFNNLLNTISAMKGKFILSSYPSDVLKGYIDKFGWETYNTKMALRVDIRRKKKSKVEVMTCNYKPI